MDIVKAVKMLGALNFVSGSLSGYVDGLKMQGTEIPGEGLLLANIERIDEVVEILEQEIEFLS
jgi:hypothetical protein